MQPLSYQVTQNSCWTTSILNGILFLLKDIDKIPTLTSHILHSVLSDEGTYYPYNQYPDYYNGIFRSVENFTRSELRFSEYRTGTEVKDILDKMHFDNTQVAICDIHEGDHSILMVGRINACIDAFDPYWDNVKKSEKIERSYETLPVGTAKNVRINYDHLFARVSRKDIPRSTVFNGMNKFKMGKTAHRSILLIEKTKNRKH